MLNIVPCCAIQWLKYSCNKGILSSQIMSKSIFVLFLNFFTLEGKISDLLSLQLTGVDFGIDFAKFKSRFHFLFLVSGAVDKLTARWNWVDKASNLVSLTGNNFSLGTIIFNFKTIWKRRHFYLTWINFLLIKRKGIRTIAPRVGLGCGSRLEFVLRLGGGGQPDNCLRGKLPPVRVRVWVWVSIGVGGKGRGGNFRLIIT